MVKTTRRVKRVKRSKKQVHRARDRKTNRRHKTNRRRYTRRQRGGMLKAMAKRFAGEKLNPKGGPNYGGIEVLKVNIDDGVRYYIGNQPLNKYAESSNQSDRDYGKLITTYLTGLVVTPDTGKTFNGQLYLDQDNFDKFEAKFTTSASGAAASGDVRRVSPNDQIRLERMIGVQGQIKLHFGKTEYILSLSRPLIIQIPPNPGSKQNPVTQLIFLATEVTKPIEGTVPEITVEFVLKNDNISHCVMQMYEQECQINDRHDEFNHETPSIKNHIGISGFLSKNIISIGSDIIPLMDKLQKFANECEKSTLEDKISKMSIGAAAAAL
jgi:hypothetical protein